MNNHQAKKLRQMARRALAAEGFTPEEIAARFRLQIRPAPWWCPARLWYAIAHRFLETAAPAPPATEGS